MGTTFGAAVVELVTTVFVLSTMFSMGVQLSASQLVDALREWRLLSRSLAVNLVAVPLIASLLVRTVSVETGFAAGIVLLAVSPGAPFGPKLAEISESDVAFASGLMAILCLLSVVTIPVSLLWLLPGDVAVDPLAIGRMVLGIQLVPLLVGLGTSFARPSLAARLHPPVQRLSDYTFVGLIVLLVVVYSDSMLALVGTGTLGLSTVAVVASLVLGYGLGGPARATREVLATTTAARNAAIALFIATTAFSDPNVLTTVLAFSFIGVVGSGLLASVWRRRPVESVSANG
ncbi:sodium symporter [Halorubellus sp. JP-L1]|uniref:bile acid:sodium symporter family protein n=1 Tax=Halorubellus sp. JP-L1 TaxID=2715753 RepID=UPI0014090333|nr:bile acid:sodium symporter [Halorubellus sp. JP-L1]NHN42879.1 sodium symporter [Halorubellus sp. JP-L1]